MARVCWFEEHQAGKDSTVRLAVESKERELQTRFDDHLQEELTKAVEEAKTEMGQMARAKDTEVRSIFLRVIYVYIVCIKKNIYIAIVYVYKV